MSQKRVKIPEENKVSNRLVICLTNNEYAKIRLLAYRHGRPCGTEVREAVRAYISAFEESGLPLDDFLIKAIGQRVADEVRPDIEDDKRNFGGAK